MRGSRPEGFTRAHATRRWWPERQGASRLLSLPEQRVEPGRPGGGIVFVERDPPDRRSAVLSVRDGREQLPVRHSERRARLAVALSLDRDPRQRSVRGLHHNWLDHPLLTGSRRSTSGSRRKSCTPTASEVAIPHAFGCPTTPLCDRCAAGHRVRRRRPAGGAGQRRPPQRRGASPGRRRDRHARRPAR